MKAIEDKNHFSEILRWAIAKNGLMQCSWAVGGARDKATGRPIPVIVFFDEHEAKFGYAFALGGPNELSLLIKYLNEVQHRMELPNETEN